MGTKRRKKRRQQNNLLVLKLLVLVALVLVLFEGKLIYTMFTHRSGSSATAAAGSNVNQPSDGGTVTTEQTPSGETSQNPIDLNAGNSVADIPLAGLAALTAGSSSNADTPETEDPNLISEEIDSPSVVKETSPPVDDSYFANAVFIGDSRMQGFRNASGITQGTFLTSVGLSTGAMAEATIDSPEGTISVYQGLSGRQYDKIYLMLGTNDLGYYPWEDFSPNFENIIRQFHKLQPNAVIYVCSVIYVEEAKITTSYDNNDNVRKINGYLLEVCEKLDYCYYINLNEIFTNGYGSLLEGASPDGIHLNAEYCVQMLTYLKNHYIADTVSTEASSSDDGETEDSETETL